MANQIGHQDLMIMAAILRLGDDAYGVSIQREIESECRRKLPTATIYLVLTRLHEKGFLKTRQGEAQQVRGGRRKTLYTVTSKGERAFKSALASLLHLVKPFAREWGLSL